MSKRARATYFPEFRLEVAQEIIDKELGIPEVSESFGLGGSTVDNWSDRSSKKVMASSLVALLLTSDQLKIRELECKIGLLEGGGEIPKKGFSSLDAGFNQRFSLIENSSVVGRYRVYVES